MQLKFLCIIRPHKAETLCQRLLAADFTHDLRVVEIRGRGKRGARQQEQGQLAYLPKVAVTVYAAQEHQDQVVDLIQSACRVGRIGDGKIFVSRVLDEVPF